MTIDTPDPYAVTFRLKRPQPSLLLMLASGYSPIYPAHVPVSELRSKCVRTGPFKLKEYRQGELIEMVKNPDYFVKGRPYLDGIRYTIIKDRGMRYSALQAGRQDIAFIWEVAKTIAETTNDPVTRADASHPAEASFQRFPESNNTAAPASGSAGMRPVRST